MTGERPGEPQDQHQPKADPAADRRYEDDGADEERDEADDRDGAYESPYTVVGAGHQDPMRDAQQKDDTPEDPGNHPEDCPFIPLGVLEPGDRPQREHGRGQRPQKPAQHRRQMVPLLPLVVPGLGQLVFVPHRPRLLGLDVDHVAHPQPPSLEVVRRRLKPERARVEPERRPEQRHGDEPGGPGRRRVRAPPEERQQDEQQQELGRVVEMRTRILRIDVHEGVVVQLVPAAGGDVLGASVLHVPEEELGRRPGAEDEKGDRALANERSASERVGGGVRVG